MGLIAHYKFDGSADDALRQFNGTVSNVTWVDGNLEKSAAFGGDAFITLPSSVVSETGDFSLSLWLYAQPSGTYCLYCARTTTGQGLAVFGIGGKIRFDLGSQWTTSVAPVVNRWTHLVLSREGGRKYIYENGVLRDSTTVDAVIGFDPTVATIGASQVSGSGLANYLVGQLSDFRIYDHALSAREVRELALGTYSRHKLAGDTLDSRLGNPLTLPGYTNESFVESERGVVADVRERSAHIALEGSLKKLTNQSVTFWAKCEELRPDTASGSFVKTLVRWGNYYDANSGGVGLYGGNIVAYLKGSTGSGWSATKSFSSAASIYDAGGWIHYAVVFETSELLSFYMNGQLMGQATLSSPYTKLTAHGFEFGENMRAMVSDIRQFATALTADQVKELYQLRASLDAKGNLHVSQLKQSPRARYIRDHVNGSTANTSAHWVEIQAYDFNGVNVALNAQGYNESGVAQPLLTDGSSATNPYVSGPRGPAFVTVDLGKVYELDTVKVWHYWSDGRTYHDARVEISEDGIHWTAIRDSAVDGEYPESSAGLTIQVTPPSAIRIDSKGQLTSKNVSEVGVTDGLVAYYPLTKNANDYSGNGHHGTVSGATLAADGYYFDGSSHIATDTAISTTDVQRWTVSSWVFIEDGEISAQQLNNFNLGNALIHSASTKKALLYVNSGENDCYTYSSGPMPIGRWAHVAFVMDMTTRDVAIFLDGAVYGRNSSRPSETDVPYGIPEITYFGQKFKGKLRDVRVYDRPLSVAEIAILHATTASISPTKMTQHDGVTYIQGEFKEL